jgi:hypothetical protein
VGLQSIVLRAIGASPLKHDSDLKRCVDSLDLQGPIRWDWKILYKGSPIFGISYVMSSASVSSSRTFLGLSVWYHSTREEIDSGERETS